MRSANSVISRSLAALAVLAVQLPSGLRRTPPPRCNVLECGEILGAVIKTAPSGARLEQDSTNGFRAIDSGENVRVRIPTNFSVIEFFGQTGSISGNIQGVGTGNMAIIPDTSADSGPLALGLPISRWQSVDIISQNGLTVGTGTGAIKWSVDGSGVHRIGSSTGPKFLAGSGSPEGSITAKVGSLYMRTDGGAGTSLYVKESGTGNTGWVAK